MIQLEKHRSGPRNLGLVVSVVSRILPCFESCEIQLSCFDILVDSFIIQIGHGDVHEKLESQLQLVLPWCWENELGSWIGELKRVWRDKGRKKWNSKLSVISIVPGHESTSQDGNYELWSSMRWERRHRASSLTCQKHDSTSYHDRGGWLSLADSTTQK